ncbi:MAG: hypothetical protein J5698_04270 [Bacteroidaceae bacterium]|nr:hypothetical protein [Bacteroidaceae bacterium]
MNITLYALSSSLHAEAIEDVRKDTFIRSLEEKGSFTFDVCGNDFGSWDVWENPVIYVRTGGTEGLFRDVYPRLQGRIRLLASSKSNSLAAAMEILSFLRAEGREGEILHGSPEYVAERIKFVPEPPPGTCPLPKKASDEKQNRMAPSKLASARLGVVGKPSDWLIASDANPQAFLGKANVALVDIPMQELLDEIRDVENDVMGLTELPFPIRMDFDGSVLDGALNIYGALKRLVAKHALNGLTVRCFDLLSAVHNTGCLALAILNAEGIPAACEGDVPALVSMMIVRQVVGKSAFQVNPSRIDPETGMYVFAHCTAPLDMLKRYAYDTHFESGIGVAVRGELPRGKVTLFKVAPDMSRCFVGEGDLLTNLNEKNLCRTQVQVHLDDAATYFLTSPIGNHHLIVPGANADALRAWAKETGVEVVNAE